VQRAVQQAPVHRPHGLRVLTDRRGERAVVQKQGAVGQQLGGEPQRLELRDDRGHRARRGGRRVHQPGAPGAADLVERAGRVGQPRGERAGQRLGQQPVALRPLVGLAGQGALVEHLRPAAGGALLAHPVRHAGVGHGLQVVPGDAGRRADRVGGVLHGHRHGGVPQQLDDPRAVAAVLTRPGGAVEPSPVLRRHRRPLLSASRAPRPSPGHQHGPASAPEEHA
jgi:hypothetical protein